MGYYSNLSGEVTFSRALNRREAQALGDDWNVYKLQRQEEERETDEGMLTIVRVTGIELEYSSEVKAYGWERVLRELIDALPKDVTASGYFERVGEESPDMERLHVVGRTVVSVKPEIIWPEPRA